MVVVVVLPELVVVVVVLPELVVVVVVLPELVVVVVVVVVLLLLLPEQVAGPGLQVEVVVGLGQPLPSRQPPIACQSVNACAPLR